MTFNYRFVLRNLRGGVGQHAERSRDLGEVSTGDKSGRLVTDSELETGRTPVNEPMEPNMISH